jgi:hypothetical protein
LSSTCWKVPRLMVLAQTSGAKKKVSLIDNCHVFSTISLKFHFYDSEKFHLMHSNLILMWHVLFPLFDSIFHHFISLLSHLFFLRDTMKKLLLFFNSLCYTFSNSRNLEYETYFVRCKTRLFEIVRCEDFHHK